MGGPRVVEDFCKCCGQRLQYVREGVRLSPMGARIFDLVKKRPGISTVELVEAVYGCNNRTKRKVIHTRIKEVNDLFAATDIIIRLSGRTKHGYSLRGVK